MNVLLSILWYCSNAMSHPRAILCQANGLSWASLESSNSKTQLDAQQHLSCWQVLTSSLRASVFTRVANCECSTYLYIACYVCTWLFKQLLTVLPALLTSSYSCLKDLGIRFVLCHQTTTLLTYQIHTYKITSHVITNV